MVYVKGHVVGRYSKSSSKLFVFFYTWKYSFCNESSHADNLKVMLGLFLHKCLESVKIRIIKYRIYKFCEIVMKREILQARMVVWEFIIAKATSSFWFSRPSHRSAWLGLGWVWAGLGCSRLVEGVASCCGTTLWSQCPSHMLFGTQSLSLIILWNPRITSPGMPTYT